MFAAVDPQGADWNVGLRRVNQAFDEIVAIMKNPNMKEAMAGAQAFERKVEKGAAGHRIPGAIAARAGETKAAYSERIAETILALRTGALWQAEAEYRGAVVEGLMARAVLAAGQYRAEQGKWPESLQVLVPRYLEAVPKDPFSREAGAAVVYLVNAEGIRMYSVGLNGEDEGGVNRGKDNGPDDLAVGVTGSDRAIP